MPKDVNPILLPRWEFFYCIGNPIQGKIYVFRSSGNQRSRVSEYQNTRIPENFRVQSSEFLSFLLLFLRCREQDIIQDEPVTG
jgi:hypothetical protein